MTEEQQYWENTQEALDRIFNQCEEIDPQSGYDMLEDIQFIRGFINKCKPRTEEQEPVLDKLRAEIKAKIEEEEFARSVFRHEEKDTVKAEQCTGSIMAYNNVIKLINKYKAEK